MERMKLSKPAIYTGPLGWGWVKLEDLAECIGQTPAETWANFFALSKDAGDGFLTWCTDEVLPEAEEVPSGERLQQVFVPAGWAGDVLRAVQLGAVRVRAVGHEHYWPHYEQRPENLCMPGTLACSPTRHIDRIDAVGLRADGTPINVPKQ